MADVGDVAIQGSDTEGNYARITGAARTIAERGALMVAIGGDHSISYPLGRGMEPLGEFDVVHVDAHADFLDEWAAPLTGASQLRRLAELPFVGTVTALGIRNVARAEVDGIASSEGGGRRASTSSSGAPARWCVRPSPRRTRSTSRSTSTCSILGRARALAAEPGGLGYRQLRAILAEVARRGRVIGFDVVELNPARDPSGATSRVAAWIVTHFLSESSNNRGERARAHRGSPSAASRGRRVSDRRVLLSMQSG